jgi:hypothetical protein
MVGVITRWDIVAHPVVTIRCFGWQVFFRAIVPWHNVSFRRACVNHFEGCGIVAYRHRAL